MSDTATAALTLSLPLPVSSPSASRPATVTPEPTDGIWSTWCEMGTELIQARTLLWRLILRDLQLRYKQAVLGYAWAILMPLMVILAGIVVRAALQHSGSAGPGANVPGSLAGMMIKALGWSFFVGALNFSVQSLVANKQLLSKIYFPREVFPLAAVCTQLVDTFVGAVFFLGFLLIAGQAQVSWALLWTPVMLFGLIGFTMGCGLLASCANLFFRDVKYLLQLLISFGIFFTPVFLEPVQFGSWGAQWVMINPVAVLLEGLKLSLVEHHSLLEYSFATTAAGTEVLVWSPFYLLYVGLATGFISIGGWWLFHRLEFIYAEYA